MTGELEARDGGSFEGLTLPPQSIYRGLVKIDAN